MGLIVIICPSCNKPHLWFTGSNDQRCEECRKKKSMRDLAYYEHRLEQEIETNTNLKAIVECYKKALDLMQSRERMLVEACRKVIRSEPGLAESDAIFQMSELIDGHIEGPWKLDEIK